MGRQQRVHRRLPGLSAGARQPPDLGRVHGMRSWSAPRALPVLHGAAVSNHSLRRDAARQASSSPAKANSGSLPPQSTADVPGAGRAHGAHSRAAGRAAGSDGGGSPADRRASDALGARRCSAWRQASCLAQCGSRPSALSGEAFAVLGVVHYRHHRHRRDVPALRKGRHARHAEAADQRIRVVGHHIASAHGANGAGSPPKEGPSARSPPTARPRGD